MCVCVCVCAGHTQIGLARAHSNMLDHDKQRFKLTHTLTVLFGQGTELRSAKLLRGELFERDH